MNLQSEREGRERNLRFATARTERERMSLSEHGDRQRNQQPEP